MALICSASPKAAALNCEPGGKLACLGLKQRNSLLTFSQPAIERACATRDLIELKDLETSLDQRLW